jgi:hypothetical protein
MPWWKRPVTGPVIAGAEPAACTAPLKPMLRAELYFGRNIGDRFAVTDRQWQGFVARELTPRFPGLTVVDGLGHSAGGNRQVRERSKIVIVVLPNDDTARGRLAAAMSAYIKQFRQKSVGQVIQPVCAAF